MFKILGSGIDFHFGLSKKDKRKTFRSYNQRREKRLRKTSSCVWMRVEKTFLFTPSLRFPTPKKVFQIPCLQSEFVQLFKALIFVNGIMFGQIMLQRS